MGIFSSKYPFTPILKYIPSRYGNQKEWQKTNQRLVYQFTNGQNDEKAVIQFVNAINNIIMGNPENWVVTFVPAATKVRHIQRYGDLFFWLTNYMPCKVSVEALVGENRIPQYYQSSKRRMVLINNPLIEGKHVILIDDVICTGKTFRFVGDCLKESGALSVHGVIYAMTIHSTKLPVKNKRKPMRKT